jgi:hypothetical protein
MEANLQGTGRRRTATEKRTFQQLQSATGGGRAMSLWKKDTDGDNSLIIGKEELADALKEKQQDLGYTMYNFTKIMKKVLTNQTPDTDHSAERLYVIPNDEVEYNLAETTTNLKVIVPSGLIKSYGKDYFTLSITSFYCFNTLYQMDETNSDFNVIIRDVSNNIFKYLFFSFVDANVWQADRFIAVHSGH